MPPGPGPRFEPRLLRSRAAARALAARLGAGEAAAVLAEARLAYPALTADLPLGAHPHLNSLPMVEAAWFVALSRALAARGTAPEAIGRVYCELFQAFLDARPAWLRRLHAWWKYGRGYVERYRRYAEATQQGRYGDEFVCTFVEGDGRTFDWGYDYTRCAILELFRRNGAADVAPYFCHVDFLLARAFGRGLERPTALSEGDDRCRFRYRKGRPTPADWPPVFLVRRRPPLD